MAEVTPWAAMLRTAVAMGVDVERFWALSVAEWRMLTQAEPGATALRRDELGRLMAIWPDGDE